MKIELEKIRNIEEALRLIVSCVDSISDATEIAAYAKLKFWNNAGTTIEMEVCLLDIIGASNLKEMRKIANKLLLKIDRNKDLLGCTSDECMYGTHICE